MPVIEVLDVVKQFSSHCALDHIHLKIEEGEILGVIGMSGAGKTTLMRCLVGLEKPCRGKILFRGEDLVAYNAKQLSTYRQKIGMVFQHFHLFPSRTVAENIAYPMEIYGVPQETIQQRTKELLELVNLTDKHAAYPACLSGGEKQRIAIARALANRPEILFCDEPTSALDPRSVESLLALLQQLNAKLGLTIVIITHQWDVVKQICSTVAFLSQGAVKKQSSTADFFNEKKDGDFLTQLQGQS